MEKIFGILEKLHKHKELRTQIVPLFLSDPGMGKTQMINQFAESKGKRVFEFITSQRSPFEISGMAIKI